jgi:DNA-binding response OmpR family regulator
MSARVLLIEDDPAILALMHEAFQRTGFETHCATNGRSGIDLFHAIGPDLVVTDIVMPEKEGMAVIIEVKKSLFDTKLIAISGGGEKGRMAYLRWAKELGADLVIRKPFRMSMLLWMAQELLREAALPLPTAIEGPSADAAPVQNRHTT